MEYTNINKRSRYFYTKKGEAVTLTEKKKLDPTDKTVEQLSILNMEKMDKHSHATQ